MTGETQDNNVWPLPKFYFTVKFGSQDKTISFQEISGLGTDTQPMEYRHGDGKQFSTIKMPGLTKGGNIILKKGVLVKDNNFFNWYDAIKMTWRLTNAWPTKISSPDLKSDANEVTIETLELAHEGLTTELET
jgi:hypothetical protein